MEADIGASCLFDLTEDGLDDLLSQSVSTSISRALELGAHPGEQRTLQLAFGDRGLAAVLLATGGALRRSAESQFPEGRQSAR